MPRHRRRRHRWQVASRAVALATGSLSVEATLTGGFPLEMLYRICHVYRLAVNAGLNEGFVEKAACWANERMTLNVLLVTGLLADHHYAGIARTFAKDGLSA